MLEITAIQFCFWLISNVLFFYIICLLTLFSVDRAKCLLFLCQLIHKCIVANKFVIVSTTVPRKEHPLQLALNCNFRNNNLIITVFIQIRIGQWFHLEFLAFPKLFLTFNQSTQNNPIGSDIIVNLPSHFVVRIFLTKKCWQS